ncbi:MAG: hypothetical protein FWE22_08480 [Firmicutes bacterium]|nr:hypothetical protein [Bacillota bacterium]
MKKSIGIIPILTLILLGVFFASFLVMNFDYIRATIRGYELFSYDEKQLVYEQGKETGEHEARQDSDRQEEYYKNIIDELEREAENRPEPDTSEVDNLERELNELDEETQALRLEYYTARLDLLTARHSIVTTQLSTLTSQLNVINAEYDALRWNAQITLANLQRLMVLSAERSELSILYHAYYAELIALNAEIEQTKQHIIDIQNTVVSASFSLSHNPMSTTQSITFNVVFVRGLERHEHTRVSGSTYRFPPLEMTGFILIGWYYDEVFNNRAGLAGDTFAVTRDITYFARIEPLETNNNTNNEQNENSNNTNIGRIFLDFMSRNWWMWIVLVGAGIFIILIIVRSK